MWLFLKRNKAEPSPTRPVEPIAQRPLILSHSELVSGMGDFSDLASEEIALKFWLPESVEQALEDLAQHYQVSVSMMVRVLLADYVYGRYALAYMRENQLGIYEHRHPALFSRRGLPPGARHVYKVPELGKNIAPIKVWIAKRLKDDLTILADHADVLLSRFVREVVVGAVLGRGTLPERPELRAVPPTPAGEAWEQGREVPMREVGRDELGELTDYEVETIYDDEKDAVMGS